MMILKSHLLIATLGFNASSLMNVKTMTGLEISNKLLDVFQDQEHEGDKAVSKASVFEMLKFYRHSCHSPETRLVNINKSLKRMEMDN
eukprot:14315406-Ditylum_brightwellii.AAC.2